MTRDDSGGPQALPDDVVRRLEEMLDHEQAAERLPTLIVGFADEGSLFWWRARGSVGLAPGDSIDSDLQYRIGSISKTFAAVAVMRLRDEGALDLNEQIGVHIEELEELPVTVGQLLSHTSGLRAETNGPWWERVPGDPFADLVATTLHRADLLVRPGRRFHYSNPGFAVLGELISRKRRAPYGDVIRTEFWDPLGMARTTVRPVEPHTLGLAVHPHAAVVLAEPEHDAASMAPAGQFWSTMADLARWSAVISGRRPDILSGESAAEMSEPIGISDVPGLPWTGGYGLGLQVWNQGGNRRYGHAGAMPGHWAMLIVDSDTKFALVAAANSTYMGARPQFFDEMLTLFTRAAAPRAEFRTGLPDPATLGLTGTWYWGPVETRLDVDKNGDLLLRGVHGHGRNCDFRPNGDGTYTGRYGYYAGEKLAIVHRADGSLSHLDIASFIYTRVPYDDGAYVPGGVDARGWTESLE